MGTYRLCITDLVTFHSSKYLTVEGVKIGSGIWKKVKWDLLNKPRIYFQSFVNPRKSVFSSILILILRVFWCFTCKYWGFWVFFIKYGACSSPQKHKFQTKLDVENFTSILFWSENVISGVKLNTSNLFNSQSNQKDMCVFVIYIWHNRKSPKPKIHSIASLHVLPKRLKTIFFRFTK